MQEYRAASQYAVRSATGSGKDSTRRDAVPTHVHDAVASCAATARAVHHVGMSVADLDAALAFWRRFLGVEASLADRARPAVPRPPRRLPGGAGSTPRSSTCRAASCSSCSPTGSTARRESRGDRQSRQRPPLPRGRRRRRRLGARGRLRRPTDRRRTGPVEVDGGPNEGARAAYLRIHDGITLELFQPPHAMSELRYERLHPAELRAAVERAPLAYVPIGTLEFHGEHLPSGSTRSRRTPSASGRPSAAGGVVLPPRLPRVAAASTCRSRSPSSRRSSHAWVRATIDQLVRRGFRAVVVLTGHGPLDLNHLLKRVVRRGRGASTRGSPPTGSAGSSSTPRG